MSRYRYLVDYGVVAELIESALPSAGAVKRAVESGELKTGHSAPGLAFTVTAVAPPRAAPPVGTPWGGGGSVLRDDDLTRMAATVTGVR